MSTTPHLQPETLAASPNLKKMRSNLWMDYKLDKNTSWVKALLLELNENASELSETEKLESSHLDLTLRIKKANKGTYGDYLLCEAIIESEFNTLCVKTAKSMKDQLNFEVKMCFLDHEFSEDEQFEEQTEHFTDGSVFELYFLNAQGEVPLAEAFHEQLFLNLDYYPTLDSVEK